jgi:hypothetical protein
MVYWISYNRGVSRKVPHSRDTTFSSSRSKSSSYQCESGDPNQEFEALTNQQSKNILRTLEQDISRALFDSSQREIRSLMQPSSRLQSSRTFPPCPLEHQDSRQEKQDTTRQRLATEPSHAILPNSQVHNAQHNTRHPADIRRKIIWLPPILPLGLRHHRYRPRPQQ